MKRPVFLAHRIIVVIRSVSDKSCRENQNTFMFSNIFVENCVIYEMM
jgi:hypothetical protein